MTFFGVFCDLELMVEKVTLKNQVIVLVISRLMIKHDTTLMDQHGNQQKRSALSAPPGKKKQDGD